MSDFRLSASVREEAGKVRAAACVDSKDWFLQSYTVAKLNQRRFKLLIRT
jgi:hypothetical protein